VQLLDQHPLTRGALRHIVEPESNPLLAVPMQTLFLGLLLLLTPADDLAAVVTPAVDDDIVAAQNNSFLASSPTGQRRLSPHATEPPTLAAPVASPAMTSGACRPAQRPEHGWLLPGSNPVYALLSLRC
jgi:hypothetical protein